MPTHAGPQTRGDFNAYDEAFARCYRHASVLAMETLLDALPKVNDGEILEHRAAFEYLLTLRQRMVDATTEAAQRYDSTTWLRLIRRLSPHALSFVTTNTTMPEGDSTQRVAENLVGSARGEILELSGVSVPTDVSMSPARLIALAELVDSLESGIRSVSKGVKCMVRNRRRPKLVASDALKMALREFDVRNAWSSADGELRLNDITGDVFSGDPPMLVAYRFRHGFAFDETWSGPFRKAITTTEAVQFTVRAFTTGSHTHTILGRYGVLASFLDPAATASLIVFGHALLHHVLDFAEDAGQTLPTLGLLSIRSEVLRGRIDDALERPAIQAWLSENGQSSLTSHVVLSCIGELYTHGQRSLPGPVTQELKADTLVDVWAYAWHVSQGLKVTPSGGRVANISGEQFELVTQELIDASVLAPPRRLRELRGRVLRLNDRPVTDVDAIVVAGRTLFLISCKRFLTPVDYLAGEHSAARNATARLDRALDEWRERIATFREFPVGDNYDFSGHEIEGFVLLPELIFTPRSDSRELLKFRGNDLFFTRVESFSQFAATLEMAGWPKESLTSRDRNWHR